MWDQDTWRFINTFAPWLAAVGTIAAVITSLWLARKANRIELELRLGIRTLGIVSGLGQFVLLRKTQGDNRKTRLNSFGWVSRTLVVVPPTWRKCFGEPFENAGSS